MTKTMKTILIATTLMFGALTATSASAFMGGKEAGSICIFGQDVHCWIDPATYSWQKDHPAFAENDIEITEQEFAMMKPRSEIKYYACMKGGWGKVMANKNSYCPNTHTVQPVWGRIGSSESAETSETTIAMMTPEMLKAWDATLTRSTTYGSIDLDEGYGGSPATELAFNRRGSTCSANPYGRRSSYCKESEVEAPLQSEVTASSEFGSCLLDDKPLDIEQLVDCRSDACLGRKFYYGSFGKVGR